MSQSSPALILLLILSGIGTFVLSLYISQRRRAPEGKALLVLMAAVAFWCFTYMLELGSAELATKLFWAKVKYFGITLVPPAWLVLTLQYTRKERWLKPRYIALLGVMPVFMLTLVWTSHVHSLFWTDATVTKTGALSALHLPVGPAFWVCAAYDYLLVLIGFVLVFDAFRHFNPLHRKQAATLLLAVLVPWVGNILFVVGWTPLPHLDLTPFAFIITCLLCAWALFRLGLLDLVPIAHATIIDGINDRIIVLDRQNRIVECNPAAQRLMSPGAEIIGKQLQEVLPEFTAQFDPSARELVAVEDVELGEGDSRRIYELRLSPLTDRKGVQVGKVIVLRDITKHRLAEESVKQQNEFLGNVLESLTHPFFVLDAQDYTVKLANSAAMVGDLSGNPTCYSITHKNNVPCSSTGHACPLKQVKKTKKPVSMEHVHEEDNGSAKHFRVYGYPILDREGNVVQMIEYHLDITNRRRMEEALRESEARLRTAIESLPFDFFIIDRNGRYAMQNSLSKKRWGNIIGKRPEDLDVDKDNLALWKSNNDRAFRGETVQGEVQLKVGAKKGYYHNIIAPVLDHGEVRGILGINIDIAERKRMEEELARHRARLGELVKERTVKLVETNAQLHEEIAERRRQEQALRESEEMYRNLFENSIQGIFITDLEGNFSSCNPALEKVLGYSAEKLLGKSFREHVTPEDAEMLFSEYNDLFQTGNPIRNLRYEAFNRCGERRTLETTVSLIKHSGRVVGFQGTAADITDQVRAEDALMESEERYRMLVDSSLTAIYVFQDGKLRFANNRSTELTGYTHQEMIGRPFIEFIYPEDRQSAEAFADAIISDEPPGGRFQGRMIHKSGAIRWLEAFASRIEYEGKPALLVNVIDVTESKEANEALRESEERFRLIAETIQSVFWISGPEISKMLYVNPAYEKVYGRTRESLYSAPRSFLDAVHPEDRVWVFESMSQRWREAWQYEYRIVRPDGCVRWIRDRGYPIHDGHGNLRLITGIATDITENKLAEAALRESEERLRALLNACTDIVFLVDTQGNFLTLNETLARRLGASVEELIGANIHDLIDPDTAPTRKEKINAAIDSHSPVRFEDERVGILFDTNVYPILDREEGGAVTQLAIYARDITEQRRAETQLRQTLEELEHRVAQRTEELSRINEALENEILERKRAYARLTEVNAKLLELERFREDLINMVAHDMKNPVSSSMLALDVIESDVGNHLSDQQTEYLRVAKRNQYKLSQMIANLLEISKLEDDRMHVIRLKVDLAELIGRTLEPLGGSLGADSPVVRVSVAPDVRSISGDPYLLERIITNILSNAMKHSDSGEDILVTVERIGTTRDVLLSIRDWGQGIPKEYHEKIFEKFFQRNLKREGHRADTGLGLAFCKLAVEALGGRIQVESEPGKGSCFTVHLPDVLEP